MLSKVMIYLYQHLMVMKMELFLLVLLLGKNVVLLTSFLNGILKIVFNVTNVHLLVHMLLFVHSLATEEEMAKAPSETKVLPAIGKGLEGLKYSIQISTLDCTGCEVCVNTCPGKKDKDGNVNKALKMVPIEKALDDKQAEVSKYFFNEVTYKDNLVDKMANAKILNLLNHYLNSLVLVVDVVKLHMLNLITQLFGDHMVVANATGCSSIYGGSFPASPYTKNILKAMVLHGLTHYLKIMLNSVSVCELLLIQLYVTKLLTLMEECVSKEDA